MLRDLVTTGARTPRLLGEFPRGFDRLFDRFWAPMEGAWKEAGELMPAANLAETATAYEVTLDLPGMKPEEVKVEMRAGDLWVTGERKEEKEEKGKTFHRVERVHGEFQRVIPMPGTVNEAAIEAEYRDGVLHVTLPKTMETKPKTITVKKG